MFCVMEHVLCRPPVFSSPHPPPRCTHILRVVDLVLTQTRVDMGNSDCQTCTSGAWAVWPKSTRLSNLLPPSVRGALFLATSRGRRVHVCPPRTKWAGTRRESPYLKRVRPVEEPRTWHSNSKVLFSTVLSNKTQNSRVADRDLATNPGREMELPGRLPAVAANQHQKCA